MPAQPLVWYRMLIATLCLGLLSMRGREPLLSAAGTKLGDEDVRDHR
jgi:hypothetical protein